MWLSFQNKGHSLLGIFVSRVVSGFSDPQTAACQAPLSFTASWSLLRCLSTELVKLTNHSQVSLVEEPACGRLQADMGSVS